MYRKVIKYNSLMFLQPKLRNSAEKYLYNQGDSRRTLFRTSLLSCKELLPNCREQQTL